MKKFAFLALAVILGLSTLSLTPLGVAADTLNINLGPQDGTADECRVWRSGTDIVFQINSGPPITLSGIDTMNINGSGDDDTLIVGFSGGNPIPVGGLTYAGGGETTGDTLVLEGGSVSTTTYAFLDADTGTIEVDGSLITYSGLEPVVDLVPAAQLTVNGSAASETISVVDSSFSGTTTTKVTVGAFESIEFANKTTAVINGLDGADSFSVDNPNPALGLTSLQLYGNQLVGVNPDDNSGDTFSIVAFGAFVALSIDGQGGPRYGSGA